ncbi:MAG: PAS domain-containing protein [Bacteroidota bacterium]
MKISTIPIGDKFISASIDITEDIKVQQVLKNNESLLAKTEDISNQGSWKCDIKSQEWHFSKNWFKILGFDKDPSIAELTQIVHPEDISYTTKCFNEAIEKKEKCEYEHRIILPSGEIRHLRVIAEYHFFIDEERAYLIGATRDITQEKNALQDLQRTTDLLTKIGEISKIGGWQLTGDLIDPYWTKGTFDIHELPYDYVPNIQESINFYHPNDREMVEKSVSEAIETGKSFQFEARIITAKNNLKWVMAKGESKMENGKCVKLSGVFQDINERKKTEQVLIENERKFRSIFEDSGVAKLLADDEGNYIDVNARACELFGYDYKQLKSMAVEQVVSDKKNNPRELFNEFLKKNYQNGEIEIIRKDGDIRIVEYYAKKISDNRNLSTLIDITKKKQSERERKKTQNQLMQITNSVPGTIYQFVFHKDRKVSMPFVNDRAYELLGFENEKMRDPEFLFSRIHPEDYAETMSSIQASNHDKASWGMEFRALNKNNEIVWIEGHSYGSADGDGNIVHNGVFLDITKQKKAEGALKISRQQYKHLTDNLPSVIFKYKINSDHTDKMLYVNDAVKEVFEVKAQDAIANVRLLWDKIHPEDLEAFVLKIQKSRSEITTIKSELRIKFHDGRIKWVDIRGVPTAQADGSVIWDTILLDITKRKKAEKNLEQLNANLETLVEKRAKKAIQLSQELELYRLATEQAKSGVWHLDLTNYKLQWDDVMYQLYGINREDFSGAYEAWEASLHLENKDEAVAAINHTIETKTEFDSLFRIVHPETGRISHIRGKGKVEIDDNDNVISVYGTNWDVTEEMQLAVDRQEALEKLKNTQTQLVQSEKMASLGVLTAGVAHELNNPLNYIVGGHTAINQYLKAEQKPKVDDINEYLDWIEKGAARATDIVKSLNLFSRNTEGQSESCDIHQIIEDCILMLKNKYKGRIEIKKDFEKANLKVSGNSGKLHQALLNLLGNAIDAIEQKGEILIKTITNSKSIFISITDDGHGIKNSDLKKVLDPFYTTKPPGKGTGLGLSITNSIILEHKGKLKLYSKLNEGTVAEIRLPKNKS